MLQDFKATGFDADGFGGKPYSVSSAALASRGLKPAGAGGNVTLGWHAAFEPAGLELDVKAVGCGSLS